MLLKTAQGHPVVSTVRLCPYLLCSPQGWPALPIRGVVCAVQLLELKNGETYNGHLVQCDSWMNIHLREVICTSKASGLETGLAGAL